MRYILIIVGLSGALLGGWVIVAGSSNARPSGEFFVQLGVVVLAVGLATIDIVEAINARHP